MGSREVGGTLGCGTGQPRSVQPRVQLGSQLQDRGVKQRSCVPTSTPERRSHTTRGTLLPAFHTLSPSSSVTAR